MPLVLAVAAPAQAAWAAQDGDLNAQADAISKQLEQQGRRIAMLNEQHNQAQMRLEALSGQADEAEARLAESTVRYDAAREMLGTQEVDSYVHSGDISLLNALVSARPQDLGLGRAYLSALLAQSRRAVTAFAQAKKGLTADRDHLLALKKSAESTTVQLAANRIAAENVMSAQQTSLNKIQGELVDLVAARAAQREQAEATQAQAKFGTPPVATADGVGVPAMTPAAGVTPLMTPTTAAASGSATSPSSTPTTAAAIVAPPTQSTMTTTTPTTAKASTGSTSSSAVPPSSGASAAVAEAQRQIGKPYVYGGAGPDSFDCSGLTAWAWRAGGKSLPHSSSAQQSGSTPVSTSALQPGDLIFYGSPAYHVGIYVGNGQMIEAPETGKNVRYASIWRSDLSGAGRP